MKRIDGNSRIFESDAYKKDRSQFHIIELNLASKDLLLYSDEETYIICRGAIGYPTWIWTIDGIDQDKMKEAANLIKEFYLTDDSKNKCTAKRDFYAFLKQSGYPYLNEEDYFEMRALECREVRQPKQCDGYVQRAVMEDADILAKYWYDDNQEMNSAAPITLQQAYEDMKGLIASETIFVWRNASDKIVCMVYYKIVGNQVRLSHVYTPIEEREKGYAANLIHDVTKLLLELDLEPLLYTDYNYAASNKAYKNAGYEETGVLINFSCNKNKHM